MDGEPDRPLAGLFDPVAGVRRNDEPVTSLEYLHALIGECDRRLAFDHRNPLVFVLVVPESIGAAMFVRYDGCNAHRGRREESSQSLATGR